MSLLSRVHCVLYPFSILCFPPAGKLDFTFVTTRVPESVEGEARSEAVPVTRPCVTFELDLANPVDHRMAVLLVEQAIKVID